ncbi:Aluminum activated malate transporter [Dorcoceras hygrometricum]|uniref:Aluminum activated malate transporter n=1 Tax=Dorcoceras hygrometricum TaxID=472368 RepID=A0A2Z7BGH5_9LAMI|nr:Aluminum activated malate transporter [Dorcoceras hygrometricum]
MMDVSQRVFVQLRDDVGATTYYGRNTLNIQCTNRGKNKEIDEAIDLSHTVEAVVHLRSLGVLTAAGCGIGSVHAVVRSNLLVEPSEVEEGEM